MADQPIRIVSKPGIKRDGTRLEGDQYVDGQWVRFQRGLPRKIGGYRSVNRYLTQPVRELHTYPQSGLTYVHAGSSAAVLRFYLDSDANSSALVDRTPISLTASDDNLWQFTTETTASATGIQLVAQVAPNLSDISNNTGGQLFYGGLFDTAKLQPVTALPTGASMTGGIVALHPYTMVFGDEGYVMWSPDCVDFTVTGAGAAYVTDQKIVRGMPLRGGPGATPSGILWSLNSVLRATYVGGTAGFSFDHLATGTTILSAQSVVEYDGVFYWAGVDRFMVFNGVVREVPNDLNINFFFDNLNFAQRQKVFAFKVPRFGEIWWCFPKDGSDEPNHAVIYNVRESVWYDTALPSDGRSAADFATVFRRPLLTSALSYAFPSTTRITSASADRILETGGKVRALEESGAARYKLWLHENGVDEVDGTDVRPIQSFFETADLSLPVQSGNNRATHVVYIEPDFVQTGDMSVAVHGRANARSPEVNDDPITFPAEASTPQEQIVFLKTQRRELRFRFESNTVGGDYQMGTVLAHVSPGDGTTLG